VGAGRGPAGGGPLGPVEAKRPNELRMDEEAKPRGKVIEVVLPTYIMKPAEEERCFFK
jgi:hypothetical protein